MNAEDIRAQLRIIVDQIERLDAERTCLVGIRDGYLRWLDSHAPLDEAPESETR